MEHFLAGRALLAGGPRRFTVNIERLLWHMGFDDVRNVDGSGDEGADLLAYLAGERWVVQCKWTGTGSVNARGVNEVDNAKQRYNCDRALLITNAVPSKAALQRQTELASIGVRIDILSGPELERLFHEVADRIPHPLTLREYQGEAIAAIRESLDETGRALLILATGLGKTVVGGEVIRHHLEDYPSQDVLVVCHMKELAAQLERAVWRHLPKEIPTHLLTGDYTPSHHRGVTFATVQSAVTAVEDGGYTPGLIMVDETHHVASEGHFQRLLDRLDGARQFGVTATPWRGDEYDISHRFGPAVFTMGIAEGMRQGYLAQVDYRLYADNVDWELVRSKSSHNYSLKELNRRLFLPQRDEAVVDELLQAWSQTPDPRAILFCETIEHAQRFAALLQTRSSDWRNARPIHAMMSRRERNVLMSDFRAGTVPIVTAVDIFNEGIDVPDVNIICFLRVTHSRRIFVQQLGRGLRLRVNKDRVRVLDFVSDIRRAAAVLELKRELADETEELVVPEPSRIEFSDQAVESLIREWLEDAADLETTADEVRLNFPDVTGVA